MTTEGMSENIRQLVAEIISKNNFRETTDIKYLSGSQPGDGYSSKTCAIEITDGEKSLNLFLKYALTFSDQSISLDSVYATEVFFYKIMYPFYLILLQEKHVEGGFRNVPKCYGYVEERSKQIIALENLRTSGFTLFNTSKPMNDEHLCMLMRIFAKFHAISFTLKDQHKKLHEEWCEANPNIFDKVQGLTFDQMYAKVAKDFIADLDEIQDKDILDRCVGLDSRIVDQIMNSKNHLSEYYVLTKGDCWVNNMMILYEDENQDHPIDMMLLDWQGITPASPVQDMAGLFYSVASKESIDNYKHYLQVYHEELHKRIEELGSDPNILYPYAILEKEWKDYGIHSLGTVLMMIKAMLCNRDKVPDFEEQINAGKTDSLSQFFANNTDNKEEHTKRMKYIARHFIGLGVL